MTTIVLAAIGTSRAEAVDKSVHSYFPPSQFSDIMTNWYSKTLAMMEESSLYEQRSSDTIYRFTWLRTFHVPVVVRIELGANSELLLKYPTAVGGDNPRLVIAKEKQFLSGVELKKILPHLEMLSQCSEPPADQGLDGAMWIFEYRSGAGYCAVDQWSPNSGGWFEAGVVLLELSGYKIEEGGYY